MRMPAGRAMFIVLGVLAFVAVLAALAVLRTGLAADRTPAGSRPWWPGTSFVSRFLPARPRVAIL
jgi:hypothetical protein